MSVFVSHAAHAPWQFDSPRGSLLTALRQPAVGRHRTDALTVAYRPRHADTRARPELLTCSAIPLKLSEPGRHRMSLDAARSAITQPIPIVPNASKTKVSARLSTPPTTLRRIRMAGVAIVATAAFAATYFFAAPVNSGTLQNPTGQSAIAAVAVWQ